MNVNKLFLIVSMCVAAAACAASSSSGRSGRKGALGQSDREYLLKVVNSLKEKGAFSEAVERCYRAMEVLPSVHHAPFRLALAQHCMEDNETGFKANPLWAKWHMEKILKLPARGNAVERMMALSYLDAIEEQQKEASAPSCVPESSSENQGRNAKRVQREYSSKEKEPKRAETAAGSSCPICEQRFETARGMHVHQARMGHKEEISSGESFGTISPLQSQSVASYSESEYAFESDSEEFGFLELTESELRTTCLLCYKTFDRIEALRLHQGCKGH